MFQGGAQDILTEDRLSSGNEAERGQLPWNLQKVPTGTSPSQDSAFQVADSCSVKSLSVDLNTCSVGAVL